MPLRRALALAVVLSTWLAALQAASAQLVLPGLKPRKPVEEPAPADNPPRTNGADRGTGGRGDRAAPSRGACPGVWRARHIARAGAHQRTTQNRRETPAAPRDNRTQ